MKPLYNYESGTGLHPCNKCGEFIERRELEVPDGTTLELCPECLQVYLENLQPKLEEYELKTIES